MKPTKQQIFFFFFNEDKEDIKGEVNGSRKEKCPVNVLMFGCSCTGDGEAAQPMQIPLSCDLECVTQQIRDLFPFPVFHCSKSFHAQHLVLSTFFSLFFFFGQFWSYLGKAQKQRRHKGCILLTSSSFSRNWRSHVGWHTQGILSF